jgi:hypothetical protein
LRVASCELLGTVRVAELLMQVACFGIDMPDIRWEVEQNNVQGGGPE